MDKMRVLIVDDNVIIHEDLRVLLQGQEEIKVVGNAVDSSEVVSQMDSLKPNVILMDITRLGSVGVAIVRQIRDLNPKIKIMVLATHRSNKYFFKMLSAGVSGYFIKSGSPAELVSALRVVSCGEVFLYPAVTKLLLNDYVQRAETHEVEDHDGLTQRELQILKLQARGHRGEEVAGLLGLSPSTVRSYHANFMSKLGLRNHTDLLKYAQRRGFVTVDA